MTLRTPPPSRSCAGLPTLAHEHEGRVKSDFLKKRDFLPPENWEQFRSVTQLVASFGILYIIISTIICNLKKFGADEVSVSVNY